MIGLRKVFTWITRSSLIFSFAFIIDCANKNDSGKQNKRKKIFPLIQHTLLTQQPLLKKTDTTHKVSNFQKVNKRSLDSLDELEFFPVKKAKRIPKVPEDKQAIALFHGLSRNSFDFKYMVEILKKIFPHAIIVPLTSVDKYSKQSKFSTLTVKLPIKEQAKLAYEEIKQKVPSGSHICLVGHSQGGLRALTVLKEYMSSLKSQCDTTIESLITIATPWKGAGIFNHIKRVVAFNQKFDKIALILNKIQPNYSEAVRKYFFKRAPDLAKKYPKSYVTIARCVMRSFIKSRYGGMVDLDPESDFISNYVPSVLKEVDLPITAIAGVLTDFSELFDSFQLSISPQELAELNVNYAELIGGDPNCEHDMLLSVATQHAEGLAKKNFTCIKVYGACHGNKVGVSIKRELSELSNNKVIDKVIESIEKTFYQTKQEEVVIK